MNRKAAVMSGTGKFGAALAVPRAVVSFLGLTAVIVGILAMHVWMGGHGPTAAHGSHAVVHSSPTVIHGSHAVAHDSGSVADMVSTAVAPVSHDDDGGAALGLCVLAFIVVTILAFLLPAGRLVPGSVLLRGPPLIRLWPLSIPTPSLIRLCISRT